MFEVVVALVVFMLALPALHQLVQIGTERAEESHLMAQASLECRSKLAEVTVGAEAMESADWIELPDPNWFWKLDASDGGVDGLKQVQVSVKYEGGGRLVQATLSQLMLDPAMRGSTQDRGLLNSAAQGSTTPSTSGATGGTTP